MAPEQASALPGLKIPFSPICTVTRRRADSESSEASGVEENVSVQQSNLTPPQLKKATKKRVRKRRSRYTINKADAGILRLLKLVVLRHMFLLCSLIYLRHS